ncbi:glutamine amidotransferase [Ignicoccus islandicus DSM 13165]|uniref:Glutamine amidotransferase n=1 Tax=Ignicoccus islandicus DSM 13165 TaxID=940295 RepID=A0A0U3FIJ5_9CREN|nr:type 1 glutamine amidotransferase domain-containing protein [Ignicoccus islandicus]ALU11718.1 glutamine amidotransferase [Ignicoccus islandicus DSM 13165]
MKAVILIGPLVDEYEVVVPYALFKAHGFEVDVASFESGKPVTGKRGFELELVPNKSFSELDPSEYDTVIIAGGYAPDKVRRDENVKKFVKEMFNQGKLILSICHGGWVLISAGIAKGKRITGSQGIWDDLRNAGAIVEDAPLVIDGNVVSVKTWREFDHLIKNFDKVLEILKNN